MTAELALDTESISKITIILDRLANSIVKLTTFAENQSSLNTALSTKLECIPKLIEKVQFLEAKALAFELENRQLSIEIQELKCVTTKSVPSHDYKHKHKHCKSDNDSHEFKAHSRKWDSVSRSQLIISGIPDTINDTANNIVDRVFHSLHTPETMDCIVSARFIRKKHGPSFMRPSVTTIAKNASIMRTSRTVIVELNSTDALDRVIRQKRVKRNLCASEVFDNGSESSLYVNECLSPEKYDLLRQVRAQANSFNFKYVWVKHGKILVRLNEKCPVYSIDSLNDLAMLKFGTPTTVVSGASGI